MNAIFTQVVEDFALSLGVTGYVRDGADLLAIELERSGGLFIESVDEDDVLVYLVREYGRVGSSLMAGALAVCHPRERHPLPVRAGRIAEERLLLAVSMPASEATVPRLTESLERLSELHDRLSAEHGT